MPWPFYQFFMTEDQIALVLKEIQQRKQELQELKKDIKEEEVIDTEEYMELKRTYKDLKAQVKDLEDRCRLELPPLTAMGAQAAACWNPVP